MVPDATLLKLSIMSNKKMGLCIFSRTVSIYTISIEDGLHAFLIIVIDTLERILK